MNLHDAPTIEHVSNSYVNFDAALASFGGDRRGLTELAGLFAMEYPDLLNGARDATVEMDRGTLSNLAREMRGLMADLGAMYASELAHRLQVHEGGRMDQIRVFALLDDLDIEMGRVREFYTHAGYFRALV